MYQNTAKTIVFYDGDCGLCNRAVVFVLKHEQNPEIQFASLQSTFAKSLLQVKAPQLQNIDSIILYTDNQFLIKSKAVILLSKHLKKPFNFLSIFSIIPSSILDWGYDFIAKNRHRLFSNKNKCALLSPDYKARIIS